MWWPLEAATNKITRYFATSIKTQLAILCCILWKWYGCQPVRARARLHYAHKITQEVGPFSQLLVLTMSRKLRLLGEPKIDRNSKVLSKRFAFYCGKPNPLLLRTIQRRWASSTTVSVSVGWPNFFEPGPCRDPTVRRRTTSNECIGYRGVHVML